MWRSSGDCRLVSFELEHLFGMRCGRTEHSMWELTDR